MTPDNFFKVGDLYVANYNYCGSEEHVLIVEMTNNSFMDQRGRWYQFGRAGQDAIQFDPAFNSSDGTRSLRLKYHVKFSRVI